MWTPARRGKRPHAQKKRWQREDDREQPSSVDCHSCHSESILFCLACERYFCAQDFDLSHRLCAEEEESGHSAVIPLAQHKFRLLPAVPEEVVTTFAAGVWEAHETHPRQRKLPQTQLSFPSRGPRFVHLSDGLLLTCFPFVIESACDLAALARVCKQWKRCSVSPMVLREVNLNTQRISDQHCLPLGRLIGLRRLKVKGKVLLDGITDRISDQGVTALRTLITLQDLRLTCRGATDSGCVALCALTNLQRLDLCGWRSLSSVSSLSALPALHSLKLRLGQVQQQLLDSLSVLTTLRRLSLRGIRSVHGSSLKPLSTLTALETLQLKDALTVSPDLSGLVSLTALDLGSNPNYWDITPTLTCLPQLTNLRFLNLSGQSSLTAAGFTALGLTTSLQFLSLARCDVPGSVLAEMSVGWSQLRLLDLAGSFGFDVADLLTLAKRRGELRIAIPKPWDCLSNGRQGYSFPLQHSSALIDFYDDPLPPLP